ncbi:hypothetical protein KXW98_002342 [Aspergillus fumigatus]|uniref:Prenylated Rab acceptor 1 n=2 Tax=Aspergillus fumigatus TaxID=746128 RepID=A0A229W2D8_ASPFM|nr:hypothetical protein CNMCM8714_001474 [Aspergillus fumigatus]KMK62992.1 hypothetical protein Y699_03822 [Aspergillus fumigatus Z5]KAF4259882.1 hypothetical protein CNMCM8057_002471 [Aspergillus fumigatus]KAF4277527.1 hypothetical protein CNMCM8689_004501 [Aspergillus fumigatus]KAF4289327.1 hypothetical protein CNMCM8686_002859 [Aspergillus fumigatus]
MPRWGRPPGARVGRSSGRQAAQWMDINNVRIQEIDCGAEEEYLLRPGRALYAAEQRRNGWPRRNEDYDASAGDVHSVDGIDLDLDDDSDSTVAYAVQLAMKDDEEWLVDKALERIRRAQLLGQKNVRLSQRELDALERKRMQTSGMEDVGQRNKVPKAASVASRPLRPVESSTNGGLGNLWTMRHGSSAPNGSIPRTFVADKKEMYESRARASGASARDDSPVLPRTSTVPNLQPRMSGPPTYSSVPRDSRSEVPLTYPSPRPPATFQNPPYARILPHGPQWVPSYQASYALATVPAGSQSHPGHMAYPATPASVLGDRHPLSRQHVSLNSTRGDLSSAADEEEDSESDNDGDRIHIVDVVRRKVPIGLQRRPSAAGGAGARAVHPRSRRS